MTFTCQRCGHHDRYPQWVLSRWRETNCCHRCARCGTPHTCKFGREAEAISPELLSIHAQGRVSPWFDGRYRPYRSAIYECEFCDGLRLYLLWNGKAWTWTGLVVDTQQLLKWRGTWQT